MLRAGARSKRNLHLQRWLIALKTGKIGIQKIKNAKKLVLYNWRPLTEFEILYKVVTAVIFTPLLLSVFQLAMSLAGYAYLTLENVISFVVKPSTLLILAVLLLLAAACAMLDISAMVFVLDQSAQKQHVTFCQIVVFAVKNSVRSWRRKNVLIVPVVLLLLPF